MNDAFFVDLSDSIPGRMVHIVAAGIAKKANKPVSPDWVLQELKAIGATITRVIPCTDGNNYELSRETGGVLHTTTLRRMGGRRGPCFAASSVVRAVRELGLII